MKTSFWTLILLTFVSLNSLGQGVLKFNKDVHNFGKVEDGPVVFFNFEAINKGNHPIVISNTESSCGCVVSEWTNKTILPNQKNIIKISFKTEGRLGVFSKNIEITSNAINKTYFLTIRGEVVEKGSIISTKTSNNKEPELTQNSKYSSEQIVLNDHNKQSNSNSAEMERLNLERPCIFNFYETEKTNDNFYYHYELKIPLKNGEYDIKKSGGNWITHYTENNYWFANGTGNRNADFKTKNEAIAYTAKYYGCANWYEQK